MNQREGSKKRPSPRHANKTCGDASRKLYSISHPAIAVTKAASRL